MVTLTSHSPEETFRLGESWGHGAQAGWIVGLCGDLGTGKTQLVKGIAAGLGVTARVHSPTFTLLNQYEGGRLPMIHLDLYRLANPEQVARAGMEDYFHHSPGVTVIEWFDRWLAQNTQEWSAHWRPPRLRRVWMNWLSLSERQIDYEDFGP